MILTGRLVSKFLNYQITVHQELGSLHRRRQRVVGVAPSAAFRFDGGNLRPPRFFRWQVAPHNSIGLPRIHKASKQLNKTFSWMHIGLSLENAIRFC